MRTKLSVVVIGAATCAAFLHCGGGDDSTGAQASDAGSDAVANDSAPSGGDASTTDSAAATIDVNGSLVGGVGPNGAIVNRDVVVIDANDVVTKVTTDASGKFVVHGVQPPYDVAVPFDPPDAATPGLARFYAGISAPNPTVTGTDYNAYPTAPQQTSTVTFTANACAACEIYFTSPDYNVRQSGTGAASPYSVSYTWSGSATHSAPMHLYVTDNSGVFQSYVDLPSTALNAGGTTALGSPTLTAVTNGNVSITVNVPASATIDEFGVTMFNTDGSSFGSSGALTTSPGVGNYPRLANVIIAANARAYLGSAEFEGNVKYSEATIPGSITMSMVASPTLLTPAKSATGVSDTDTLTWSAFGTSPTTYVVVLWITGGAYSYVYTDNPSFTLGRLTKGGMGLSSATNYNWEVVAGGNYASVDDVVQQTAAANGVITYNGNSLPQTFTTK
jgi:hypothetical protein